MNCSRRFIECDVTHRTNILELLPRVFFPPEKKEKFLQLAAAFPPPSTTSLQQDRATTTRKGSRKTWIIRIWGFKASKIHPVSTFHLFGSCSSSNWNPLKSNYRKPVRKSIKRNALISFFESRRRWGKWIRVRGVLKISEMSWRMEEDW